MAIEKGLYQAPEGLEALAEQEAPIEIEIEDPESVTIGMDGLEIELEPKEETADDLYRKIDALDAVINDGAATDGEKENAKSLKAKLQARLQSDYPGQKPGWVDDLKNSWFGQMAKAAGEQEEREKYWRENPGAEEAYWMQRYKDLRARRSRVGPGYGNVERAEMYRELSYEIDRLLRDHLPDEWKKVLAQREKSRQAGYKYQAKKAAAKKKELNNKIKQQKEKGGLENWKVVNKEYIEPLSRFYELLKDTLVPKWTGMRVRDFGKASTILMRLTDLATGDIRRKWSELSPEDQVAVKQAVEKVNTLGYKANGYTVAQKAKILDAMRPSKAPPPRNPNWYQDFLKRKAENREKRGW